MPDDGAERLIAPIQTMFTPSARDEIKALARTRHLAPSVLVRVVVMEWLAQQKVKA